jgi:branched-chain amino acid transport system permease protein
MDFPNFAPFIIPGLAVGAIYALSGVGLLVLYQASGILNFAYGAIGAVSAMMTWQLLQWEIPVLVACAVGILLSVGLSFLYGKYLAPRLAYRDAVVKAVATLGFALILMGALEWQFSINRARQLRLPTDAIGFELFDSRVTLTRLIAFLLALLVTIGVALFLTRTRTGILMRALANNRDLSSLLGVRVAQVETTAWVMSGLMAGISGLLLGSLTSLNATLLTFMVIPALATAIVGQLRSLWLTLAGGLCIGLLESMAIPIDTISPYRAVTPFIVALLVILWQQRGQRRSLLTISND